MDKNLLRGGVELILEGLIGENWKDDPNFTETPERAVRAYAEIFSGYEEKNLGTFFEKAFPAKGYQSMIFCSGIRVYSMCPHHLLPVTYEMAIGYIPSEAGKVIGASKLPRLAEYLAARAIVQEEFTDELANAIEKYLAPAGIAIVCSGQHLCMSMRGVKQRNSTFETSEMRGSFRDHISTRNEFFSLLANSKG